MGYKRHPMVKRRKLHSKGTSHVQVSSTHLGVKRHFAEQNFIPKPFDGSTVKGKLLRYFRRMHGGSLNVNYSCKLLLLSRSVALHLKTCQISFKPRAVH